MFPIPPKSREHSVCDTRVSLPSFALYSKAKKNLCIKIGYLISKIHYIKAFK